MEQNPRRCAFRLSHREYQELAMRTSRALDALAKITESIDIKGLAESIKSLESLGDLRKSIESIESSD